MSDSEKTSRRKFAAVLASLFSGLAMAKGAFGLESREGTARLVTGDELVHSTEAIHQEVIFNASRKRVYEALTDAKQFDKVVQLSAAVKSGMSLGSKPTEVSSEAGGAFTIFGGYIAGRQIELVPDNRIVQAWRTASWSPGVYSIAKFELVEQESGTKLIFDHTGFPEGQGQHLAEGWKVNYWEPLEKYLTQP